jgi:hypothetical protein
MTTDPEPVTPGDYRMPIGPFKCITLAQIDGGIRALHCEMNGRDWLTWAHSQDGQPGIYRDQDGIDPALKRYFRWKRTHGAIP